ncbi:unnamed protein product [Paramecium sonneborni]|uniref:Uncharacterized protein n=1 Tax=Paramecium sonneborni TaxID=65129 RepID=A0A8S1PLZ3_9CILI|nr:unnamed protein product [Paramecium sonneborni]
MKLNQRKGLVEILGFSQTKQVKTLLKISKVQMIVCHLKKLYNDQEFCKLIPWLQQMMQLNKGQRNLNKSNLHIRKKISGFIIFITQIQVVYANNLTNGKNKVIKSQ